MDEREGSATAASATALTGHQDLARARTVVFRLRRSPTPEKARRFHPAGGDGEQSRAAARTMWRENSEEISAGLPWPADRMRALVRCPEPVRQAGRPGPGAPAAAGRGLRGGSPEAWCRCGPGARPGGR
ncbi:hypothetical protein [Peterkaempfera sp. SMS 1(5)a]|uniref:hypothetical protein n=1 Tax=Peterkaempfera podocarpi TaxID=3232308 RepID=UPI003670E17A